MAANPQVNTVRETIAKELQHLPYFSHLELMPILDRFGGFRKLNDVMFPQSGQWKANAPWTRHVNYWGTLIYMWKDTESRFSPEDKKASLAKTMDAITKYKEKTSAFRYDKNGQVIKKSAAQDVPAKLSLLALLESITFLPKQQRESDKLTVKY